MSALSIIVPVSSEAPDFKDFLTHLLRAVAPLNGCEIIVVDGTTGTRIASICRSNGVCVLHAVGDRLAQMNRGAAQAHSDYQLFLDPHITLPANFADIWRAIRRAGPEWGFFSLRINRASWRLRWLAKMISLRSRMSGVAVEDQPLFVQRDAWKLTGHPGGDPVGSFSGLCRRLRVIASPWVVREPVETEGARWQDAGLRCVLRASLSSRLHLGRRELRPAGVAGGKSKAGTGRKHAPELP